MHFCVTGTAQATSRDTVVGSRAHGGRAEKSTGAVDGGAGAMARLWAQRTCRRNAKALGDGMVGWVGCGVREDGDGAESGSQVRYDRPPPEGSACKPWSWNSTGSGLGRCDRARPNPESQHLQRLKSPGSSQPSSDDGYPNSDAIDEASSHAHVNLSPKHACETSQSGLPRICDAHRPRADRRARWRTQDRRRDWNTADRRRRVGSCSPAA